MYTQTTADHLSELPNNTFTVQQHMPIAKDQVTIVIPVKNEELAINLVIDELIQEGYDNILVVDGYSADKTLQIIEAKKGVTLIQQHGKGKTGAIKTAIENVTTPYMLILDGDYTYQAKDIQRLLNHCANYAHVIGVRDRKNIGLTHRFGNWIITKAFNLLMGTHLSDICSGMNLLKTDVAKNIELGSSHFAKTGSPGNCFMKWLGKIFCFLGFHKWFDGRGNGLPIYCVRCFATFPFGRKLEVQDNDIPYNHS
jgi:glycosyltransferase involved in cell wall biosynthesis